MKKMTILFARIKEKNTKRKRTSLVMNKAIKYMNVKIVWIAH
ncbi:MAG: hypothetical protein ACFWT6_00445 [Virgibacillus proomii]|jgi:hypothetical protein